MPHLRVRRSRSLVWALLALGLGTAAVLGAQSQSPVPIPMQGGSQ